MSGDTLYNYVTSLVDEATAQPGDVTVKDTKSGGTLTMSGDASISSAVTLFGRPTIQIATNNLQIGGGSNPTAPKSGGIPFDASFYGLTDAAVEMWIYPTSYADEGPLLANQNGGFGWTLWLSTSGQVGFAADNSWAIPYGGSAPLNQWTHIALVLTQSTHITLYVGGVPVGSTTISLAAKMPPDGGTYWVCGNRGGSSGMYRGFIGPVRVTRGAARYTAAFTPPTEAFPTTMASSDTSSGSSSTGSTTTTATDPHFSSVTTLVDESLASAGDTRVLDLISGAYLTLNNGPAVSNEVQLFGRPTIKNTGAGYGWLTPEALDLSTADAATLEFWVYPTAYNAVSLISTGNNNGSMAGYFLGFNAGGQVCLYAREYFVVGYQGPHVPLNQWTHIALVITNATTCTIYVGGVLVGSGTVADRGQALGQSGTAYVGNTVYNDGTFVGYLGPLRITKGVARYTSEFTPTASPFPAIGSSSSYAASDSNYFAVSLWLDFEGGDGTSTLDVASTSIIDKSLWGQPVIAGTKDLAYAPAVVAGGGSSGKALQLHGSDFLYVNHTSHLKLSDAKNWTVEALVYITTDQVADGGTIVSKDDMWGSHQTSYRLCVLPGGIVRGIIGDPGTSWNHCILDSTATLTYSAWNHVALVRSGGTLYVFVNGKGISVATDLTMGDVGQALQVGRLLGSYDAPFAGLIDDLKITKGLARYTTDFTWPSVPTTYATDDHFDSVVLLLESGGDGTFTDKSKNGAALTFSGSSLVSSQVKFGSVSLQPQFTYLPNLADYDLGSDNFTIDGWAYLGAKPSPYGAIASNTVDPSMGWRLFVQDYIALNAYWTGQSTVTETLGVMFPVGQWVHFAAVRHGNTLTTYVNGVMSVKRVADTLGSINSSTSQLELGGVMGGYWPFPGFIDSLRITKGVARYLGGFTPPTAAFPAIATPVVEDTNTGTDPYFSHVKVLMTMDGAAAGSTSVHDALGNTITCENGAAVTTAKTHFGRPTIALTGAGNGRLVLNPPSALNLSGVNASTVEGWIYPTAIPSGVVGGGHCSIFSSGTSTGGMGGFFVTASTTGQLGLYMREYWCVAPGAAGAIKLNAWNHIAVCFVGATAYLFANGVLQGTGAISTANPALSGSDFAAVVGSVYADATPSGYMGQFRVTEGVARYLSGFTPPTQAFPTAATTSASGAASDGAFNDVALLLHCNDASYLDSSTHGFRPLAISGVSVSASHTLLGGAALQFDGTGTGLSYAHADALNLATIDFTIELAVYLPALGNFCLFQKDQHFGSTFTSYSAQVLADGSIFMSVGTGSSSNSAQNIQTPAGTLTPGVFHRLAFVRSGRQVYIFVDGALITVDTQTASPADGASPLVFGYFPANGANNDWRLVGYLDEIRITRSARYTAAYTVAAQEFGSRKPYFAGTVLDESGAPAARTILALRRDTCTVVATTTSSASDGSYKLETPYAGEHDLIAQDSTGHLADLIITRVIPV